MRITNKRYTFASATKLGLAPDERCDWCGGKFTELVKHDSPCGMISFCCSESCSAQFWEHRATDKSFRRRFRKLLQTHTHKEARALCQKL